MGFDIGAWLRRKWILWKHKRAQKAKLAEKRKRNKKEMRFNRDSRNIYWGTDGNLYSGSSIRNRDEELLDVLQADHFDQDDTKALWVIIPSRWIRKWILFCQLRAGDEPGKITMMSLLVKDPLSPGGYRPKNTLKPANAAKLDNPNAAEHPGHYRRISVDAWNILYKLYGADGPALAVWGIPTDELARWRVFSNPLDIYTSMLPEPVIPIGMQDEKKEEEDDSLLGAATKRNPLNLFGGGKQTLSNTPANDSNS